MIATENPCFNSVLSSICYSERLKIYNMLILDLDASEKYKIILAPLLTKFKDQLLLELEIIVKNKCNGICYP